ncbi:MAG: hypothetical protein MHPSP_000062 [Paramarteilia canceri]
MKIDENYKISILEYVIKWYIQSYMFEDRLVFITLLMEMLPNIEYANKENINYDITNIYSQFYEIFNYNLEVHLNPDIEYFLNSPLLGKFPLLFITEYPRNLKIVLKKNAAVYDRNFSTISLGVKESCPPNPEVFIHTLDENTWLIVENCYLDPSYTMSVIRAMKRIKNLNFKLFLISSPKFSMPEIIFDKSITSSFILNQSITSSLESSYQTIVKKSTFQSSLLNSTNFPLIVLLFYCFAIQCSKYFPFSTETDFSITLYDLQIILNIIDSILVQYSDIEISYLSVKKEILYVLCHVIFKNKTDSINDVEKMSRFLQRVIPNSVEELEKVPLSGIELKLPESTIDSDSKLTKWISDCCKTLTIQNFFISQNSEDKHYKLLSEIVCRSLEFLSSVSEKEDSKPLINDAINQTFSDRAAKIFSELDNKSTELSHNLDNGNSISLGICFVSQIEYLKDFLTDKTMKTDDIYTYYKYIIDLYNNLNSTFENSILSFSCDLKYVPKPDSFLNSLKTFISVKNSVAFEELHFVIHSEGKRACDITNESFILINLHNIKLNNMILNSKHPQRIELNTNETGYSMKPSLNDILNLVLLQFPSKNTQFKPIPLYKDSFKTEVIEVVYCCFEEYDSLQQLSPFICL